MANLSYCNLFKYSNQRKVTVVHLGHVIFFLTIPGKIYLVKNETISRKNEILFRENDLLSRENEILSSENDISYENDII